MLDDFMEGQEVILPALIYERGGVKENNPASVAGSGVVIDVKNNL